MMIDAADIDPADTLLETDAGSSYAAAVVSRIAARVIATGCEASLVAMAKEHLTDFGCANAEFPCGDERFGSPRDAAFDTNLASAASLDVPRRASSNWQCRSAIRVSNHGADRAACDRPVHPDQARPGPVRSLARARSARRHWQDKIRGALIADYRQ